MLALSVFQQALRGALGDDGTSYQVHVNGVEAKSATHRDVGGSDPGLKAAHQGHLEGGSSRRRKRSFVVCPARPLEIQPVKSRQ
jgi:hypothetical protein